MAQQKTIKIFLIDGEITGRLSCELSNWSGKAYKIPRALCKKCIDREDMYKTGIYLLFGKDENEKDLIYVGEAESILKRIENHLTNKDFWTETILFMTKDNNLNKAHAKYLESRLYDIAKGMNRYKLLNTSIPPETSLSESDIAEMEEFLGNIRLITTALGHKVFEEKRNTNYPINDASTDICENKNIFYLDGTGYSAQGEPTIEGFVIFKGSVISLDKKSYITPNAKKIRTLLVDNNILQKKDDHYELMEDYIFNSPSLAATFVCGSKRNGVISWRTNTGETLKDVEQFKTQENLNI